MFPQPQGVTVGVQELLPSLLSLSSAPLNAGSTALGLGAGDVESFVGDLAKRFADDGLEDIFGDVITTVVSALPNEGLGGGGSEWRGVVGALEALVSDKNVATIVSYCYPSILMPRFIYLCVASKTADLAA